jgi:hypothetical protein
MNNWLDWCENNAGVSGVPLKVCLRPRMGFFAPEWVKNDPNIGRLQYWENDGVANFDPAEVGGAPPSGESGYFEFLPGCATWWRPKYREYQGGWLQRLAEAFGDHPAVCEIDIAYASTHYTEPCIKQWGCQANIASCMTAPVAWNMADEIAAYEQSWRDAVQYFGRYRVAVGTSYNPGQTLIVDSSKYSGYRVNWGDIDHTLDLMSRHKSICRGLTIWGNHSLQSPWQTSGSPEATQMYQAQVDGAAGIPSVALMYQSITLAKFKTDYSATSNVQETVNDAISMGAVRLEIPVGCQNYDASYPLNYISTAFATSAGVGFEQNAARYRA